MIARTGKLQTNKGRGYLQIRYRKCLDHKLACWFSSYWLWQVLWHKNYWITDLSKVFPLAESHNITRRAFASVRSCMIFVKLLLSLSLFLLFRGNNKVPSCYLPRSAGLCTGVWVDRKVSINLPSSSRFVFRTKKCPYTCRGLAGLDTHPQAGNLGRTKTVHKPAKVCRFVTEQEKKSR